MASPTEPEPEARATLLACHRNTIDAAWALIRLGPGPRRRDWSGDCAMSNAIPASVTHTLFATTPGVDAPTLLEAAGEFFGRGAPWKVVATPDTIRWVQPAAVARGMLPIEPEPGLLLDPIPPAPAPPSGLEVREVSGADELREFREVAGLGFRIPRWILRVSMPGVPRDPGAGPSLPRFFVGRVGGRPVACSLLYVSHAVAGISFVATVPRSRRRGYGAALTWAALEAGRATGARVGYLQASVMGRPVYEAMGFREVSTYAMWSARMPGYRIPGAVGRMLWLGLTVR